MNLIVLSTGITTKHNSDSKNIKVHSSKLKKNSIFNLTLKQYTNVKNKKIGSIHVPENKLTFNKWINKVWEHKIKA